MRKLLFIGIALAIAACGDDATSPSPAPIPGTYDLTKVDGQALPFLALDLGAYRVKVLSGSLTLRSDGTYSFEVSHRTHDSGNIRTGTDTDGGSWTVKGDTITLDSTDDDFPRSGVVSGGAITLQSSARLLVLTKQQR